MNKDLNYLEDMIEYYVSYVIELENELCKKRTLEEWYYLGRQVTAKRNELRDDYHDMQKIHGKTKTSRVRLIMKRLLKITSYLEEQMLSQGYFPDKSDRSFIDIFYARKDKPLNWDELVAKYIERYGRV